MEAHNVTVVVTVRPKPGQILAGGPIELDLWVTNRTPVQIFYLVGNAHARPAYLKFSAERTADRQRLRDPYPQTPLTPTGPIASIPLDPGQTDKRTILLNQYVALEDTRAAIAPGQRAPLRVHWDCFIAASRTPQSYLPDPEQVSGEFQVEVLRDDESLRRSIDALAAKLKNDSQAVPADAVGRRDVITALVSLRIPEVAPYLRQLLDFPDFEIRTMAQHALAESEHAVKH